ncbi:proton-conducting transporter transmembrane domain-containing protein [Capillimicrobium parvum]|uniref:Hydrogenase-4 component B n=1 Tax=Capillimicrobium parvum TaxID=2884022 RepID=A0A9E7C0N2_9ACTN|nr:proton-conducting transporter membrane subunit [Capillimicrobium parvum]UGS35789.1 Hydrogenase-4 component B [Capillimicrobium parvum]
MTPATAICLAGAAGLVLGGALPAASRAAAALRAGLTLQALGAALLGVGGVAILAAGGTTGAPLSAQIRPALGLDPLSGLFLVVLGLTATPALLFARGYLPGGHAPRAVAVLTAAFLLSLAGLLAARDVTTFLGFWEAMTIVPAAAILAARRDDEARSAVLLYLGITHLGGAGVWVALLALVLAGPGGATGTLIAVAALVGFGTKAGLAPLHAWLPRAHPVAPAHLSALMSGLMVKVALYGLIRVELEWLAPAPLWLGLVLMGLGLASALGGVLYALVQGELKRLLAFSTIENVGIVTAALGASVVLATAGEPEWSAIAFAAGLLHLVNHAVFKTLLFLGAGAFERATGGLDLDRLGGLLRRMPWTGGAFAIGLLAIAGLPPLNGFASEWLVLQSMLHVALDGAIGISLAGAVALAGIAATAGLAALCFTSVFGLTLLGAPRRPEVAQAREAAWPMRAGMVLLAVPCVVLGLVPGLVLPVLVDLAPSAGTVPATPGLDLPATGSLPTAALAIAVVLVAGLLVAARGRRRAAPAPAWTCGQRVVPELSWTAAGYAKPLRLVLEAVLRPRRRLEVTEAAGVVTGVDYASEVALPVDRFVSEHAARHGLRGAAFVRRLQTGNVRTYAAYLLALVLGLLALARTGALG